MSLTEYQHKRNFTVTSEPAGKQPVKDGWLYVVQKHDASHLHYDFRLQLGAVLKSWAVPKGPSLDPKVKRLAVHVEDHPVEYGGFEGIIPQGQYGGGTVTLWDQGDWEPLGDPADGYRKGHLKFNLHGDKLKGRWVLVRKGGARDTSERNWFLIKEADDYSSADEDITESSRSVMTSRTMDEIANESDRVWQSKVSEAKGSLATKKNTLNGLIVVPKNATLKSAASKTGRTKSSSNLTRRASAIPAAVERRMPSMVKPQLATLVDSPPSGTEWFHEIKFDGYRILCHIDDGSVRFVTRNQQDWTKKLPHLARCFSVFPVKQAILDGELVMLDASGVSRFQLLQNAFKNGSIEASIYYAFDLLYLNGIDLTKASLEQRKELLRKLLNSKSIPSQVQFADHLNGDGVPFFEVARKQHLEGIISKRSDAPYTSGRTNTWLKCKCIQSDEFVIGGYTDPGGTRQDFGALLIGYFDDKQQLIYAGKVGTGFSQESLASILSQLEPLVTDRTEFLDVPRQIAAKAHWVKPEIVAQIEFIEWTSDGRLRHPSFVAIREDKPAREVTRAVEKEVANIETHEIKNSPPASRSANGKKTTASINEASKTDMRKIKRETSMKTSLSSHNREESMAPVKGRNERASMRSEEESRNNTRTPHPASPRKTGARSKTSTIAQGRLAAQPGQERLTLTHPDKILYPEQGYTKRDVADYLLAISKSILPQIDNRLVVLVRCPDGIGKETFYQKHPGRGTPESIKQIPVVEKSATANYAVIENAFGLSWAAQMAALELHVWGSTADDLERPDRLIFDLDPGPEVEWPRLTESAQQIKEFLSDLGLETFLKTTGGKGLHLVVPIQRRSTWEEAKAFCHAVATAVAAADSKRYTANMSKAERPGKIYVDYLRNQRGATAVAAYSLRARPGAPVSTPIDWRELNADTDLRLDYFNINTVPERLKKMKSDPWERIGKMRQSITLATRKKLGLG